ncbi:MAG: class I fructose-bisphosphate aldolase, partial [Alphaproteobacteria bacterium]
ADESTGTIGQRLASIGVESTEESRRDYRQVLLTAPDLGQYISGVILYDETLRQSASDGRTFVSILQAAGVIPGIKVDTGMHPLAGFPGEKVAEGLDGLRQRLADYHRLGARFAKWRAALEVNDTLPSDGCISANVHALARYAALCQEAGIVPMVEPEVLMNGDHSIERCEAVTETVLRRLFAALADQNVSLEGLILKTNMVVSGEKNRRQAPVDEVAAATVRCFLRAVPAAVPGIAFLSGGQSDAAATAHLDAMNRSSPNLPWTLSFSYGRALQAQPLKIWAGKPGNVAAAQKALLHRSRMNALAATGQWSAGLEQAA